MPKDPARRKDFVHFRRLQTRWRDNDVYGHMNNAVFYEYIDTAVNHWIVETGALPVPSGGVVGLVVETRCVFHAALGFPDPVDCGLRVAHIGTSAVRYELGLFRGDATQAAAEAHFVHVYVDAATHRPAPVPEAFRAALETLRSQVQLG